VIDLDCHKGAAGNHLWRQPSHDAYDRASSWTGGSLCGSATVAEMNATGAIAEWATARPIYCCSLRYVMFGATAYRAESSVTSEAFA
jgi:hypothetical protein